MGSWGQQLWWDDFDLLTFGHPTLPASASPPYPLPSLCLSLYPYTPPMDPLMGWVQASCSVVVEWVMQYAPSRLAEFEFLIKSDSDFDFNATFYTDIVNL